VRFYCISLLRTQCNIGTKYTVVCSFKTEINVRPVYSTYLFNISYRMPADVYMDDTEGVFVFGGLDTTPSFRGYIGQATYYRNRALDSDKVSCVVIDLL